jgi:isopentenyl phosphate kinase
MTGLTFLKLGGSLITDKQQRYTARLDRLDDLATEIASALREFKGLRLVLGHGSGSFGHFAVQDHLANQATMSGPRPNRQQQEFWRGVSEVWYRASELNRLVMDALHRAGVSAIALAPSASALASAGAVAAWSLSALEEALAAGLLPVIFGDIVLDVDRGASVLSTEILMLYLARRLLPHRILLAGIEEAVWADYPKRQQPIHRITPGTYEALGKAIGRSHGTDVTGGMRTKVEQMLEIVADVPGLEVQIFSGSEKGNLRRALGGEALGTTLSSD